MKNLFTLFVFIISGFVSTFANNYSNMEPIKLEVPELKADFKAYQASLQSSYDLELRNTPLVSLETDKYQMMLSNPTEKPNFKFLDDITAMGPVLFAAGIIAKGEKAAFRQNYDDSHTNTRLVTHFKSEVDNYTQFAPPALALGLKVAGVEGRSDWFRFAASSAMSYALMATFVNGIKYTAKEMRPDGSTANSWPSGHTATAFVGATILHKEYGLTRSPWYSVAGYGVATATGVMRVLNNRHWVSNVLSGAGIGILSGELAYAFSDLIFKDKHLLRGNLNARPDLKRTHPSFFDISMGIGFGNKTLDFNDAMDYDDEEEDYSIQLRAATVMQAEGAYFLNNFFGIGGRLRVRSSPVKGWNRLLDYGVENLQLIQDMYSMSEQHYETRVSMDDFIESSEFAIVSDHITEFSGDAGFYFNIPLTNRLALGTKLLIGQSIMQAIEIDATVKGMGKTLHYDVDIRNNEVADHNIFALMNSDPYECTWNYLTIEGNNSTKYGTGISLTYAYKGNYCWKIFCDYDYTHKTYTMTYDLGHFMYDGMPTMISYMNIVYDDVDYLPEAFTIKKKMHTWVLGASLSVSF